MVKWQGTERYSSDQAATWLFLTNDSLERTEVTLRQQLSLQLYLYSVSP